MRVRVLIEYTEIPAVEELEALRQASLQLTTKKPAQNERDPIPTCAIRGADRYPQEGLARFERFHCRTSSPESVSVQLIENSKYPTIILEFQMKTQAQYKVVDKIDRTVKFYMASPFYSDSSISFS